MNCLPLTANGSPLTAHRLLLTAYRSRLTEHGLLLIGTCPYAGKAGVGNGLPTTAYLPGYCQLDRPFTVYSRQRKAVHYNDFVIIGTSAGCSDAPMLRSLHQRCGVGTGPPSLRSLRYTGICHLQTVLPYSIPHNWLQSQCCCPYGGRY